MSSRRHTEASSHAASVNNAASKCDMSGSLPPRGFVSGSIEDNKDARIAKLEAVAVAVERWLSDPRYVTEQSMMKALRELKELDRRRA